MSRTTSSGEAVQAKPLLVVGCGNWFGGDDRVGLVIAQRLCEASVPNLRSVLLPQRPFDLLDLAPEADRIVFVDAVETGSPPGTLFLCRLPSPRVQPRALSGMTGHGWSLGEIIDLAEALGRPLPEMHLVGIELESVTPSEEMSVPVAGAAEFVVVHFAGLAERCREIGSSDIVRVDH